MNSVKPEQRSSLDIIKLIQPDLLTIDELVEILQERGVRPSCLSNNKEKLVSLFKRVALPLPQRELRHNYRGSLLMKMRKKFERKRIGMNEIPLCNLKSCIIGDSESAPLLKKSQNEKIVGDRLKPPPDLVNHEKKKIKINSSCSSSHLSSDLDKIVIKHRKNSENSNNSSSPSNNAKNMLKLKEIKNKDVSESCESSTFSTETCNGSKSNSIPKKISLKRNHLSSTVSTSTSVETQEKTILEPDKKRKPIAITWP